MSSIPTTTATTSPTTTLTRYIIKPTTSTANTMLSSTNPSLLSTLTTLAKKAVSQITSTPGPPPSPLPILTSSNSNITPSCNPNTMFSGDKFLKSIGIFFLISLSACAIMAGMYVAYRWRQRGIEKEIKGLNPINEMNVEMRRMQMAQGQTMGVTGTSVGMQNSGTTTTMMPPPAAAKGQGRESMWEAVGARRLGYM